MIEQAQLDQQDRRLFSREKGASSPVFSMQNVQRQFHSE
jgi:hypothetical protein